jgi:hypothetical protein
MMHYQEYGEPLTELGYDITPLKLGEKSKRPLLGKWQTRPDIVKQYEKYGDRGVGVLTGGRHNLIAVDIDVLDESAASIIRDLAIEQLGYAPERIGKAPKTLLVYRCTEKVRKTKTELFHISGHDACVEVLAEGQQFAAIGIHPDTQQEYEWPGDTLSDIAPDQLSAVTPDAIRNFLGDASSVLSKFGAPKTSQTPMSNVAAPAPNRNHDPLGLFSVNAKEVEAALAVIPSDDYDTWIKIAHAIKGALGDEGFGVFNSWSNKSERYDATETKDKWSSIGNVNEIGAGTIFQLAKDFGFEVGEFRTRKETVSPPLSIDEWRKRKIPPHDLLLGALFSTTTRATLVAPTGLGKTNFALAMGAGMATGRGFLHFDSRRQARVLVIDGELPAEWAKQLLADMEERLGDDAGLLKEKFFYLNTEDAQDFQPLNTVSGQNYIEDIIASMGGVDFIIFDNIMSLLAGSMKEEESWAETLPWIKSLTRRRIGQLWIHHTGINEARGYGTDTKNWQFDTVMLMERNHGSQADISFNLKFQKARRRTPKTRQYYEPVTIELIENEWRSSEAVGNSVKLPPREKTALRILQNLLAEKGEKRVTMRDGPVVTACLLDDWREQLKQRGVTNEDKPSSERSQWRSIKNKLQSQQVITINGEWVWIA